MDELSDAAWRIFTNALMWSNLNGTDGWIPDRYQIRMHASSDPGVVTRAEAELVGAGLIVKGRDEAGGKGYQMPRWSDTDGLNQSTAEEMKIYKANAAVRAKKYRDSQKAKLAKAVGFETTDPASVTRDATRDVREHVGEGKGEGKGHVVDEEDASQKTKVTSVDDHTDSRTGEVFDEPKTVRREGNRVHLVPRTA